MSECESGDHHPERYAAQRKNKRVKIRFPVTVEAPAGGGRTRTLTAQTVIVSHAGATLDVEDDLAIGLGVQLTPPFGGTLLAEINGNWVDRDTGRRRISVRLIDPATWTSPERLVAPQRATCETGGGIDLPPRAHRMLSEYAAYLQETSGYTVREVEAAESLIERVFLTDEKFQNWFAEKIMEDLQTWEETSVKGPPREEAPNDRQVQLIVGNTSELVFSPQPPLTDLMLHAGAAHQGQKTTLAGGHLRQKSEPLRPLCFGRSSPSRSSRAGIRLPPAIRRDAATTLPTAAVGRTPSRRRSPARSAPS